MVLKTKSWSLLTMPSRSSPSEAISRVGGRQKSLPADVEAPTLGKRASRHDTFGHKRNVTTELLDCRQRDTMQFRRARRSLQMAAEARGKGLWSVAATVPGWTSTVWPCLSSPNTEDYIELTDNQNENWKIKPHTRTYPHSQHGRSSYNRSRSLQELDHRSFHSNHTFKDISARLSREHNVTCNNCTIEQRLKTWEVSKRVRTENSSDLEKWVTALFYKLCLSDKKILHILSEKKWTISYWELVWMC
jgi:hypothetical protein